MLRIAAAQFASPWLDRLAGVEKVCKILESAGDQGIELVVFPENFIPGHPSWYHYHAESAQLSGEYQRRLLENAILPSEGHLVPIQEVARRRKIVVVLGATERSSKVSGTLYNSQYVIDRDGRLIGKHQKLVATKAERMVHAPGREDLVLGADSSIGTISTLICGENSNPFALAALAARYPLIHAASWPAHVSPNARRGIRHISQVAGKAVARMLGCFTVNAVGVNSEETIDAFARTDEDRRFLENPDFSGGSFIANPFGEVIAGPLQHDVEELVVAEIDPRLSGWARQSTDFGGHYNRTDVFELRVRSQPSRLVTWEEA